MTFHNLPTTTSQHLKIRALNHQIGTNPTKPLQKPLKRKQKKHSQFKNLDRKPKTHKPKNSDWNLRTFGTVRSKKGEMRGVHHLCWRWQVTAGLEELGHGGYALREREREKVSHGGYVEREREREMVGHDGCGWLEFGEGDGTVAAWLMSQM